MLSVKNITRQSKCPVMRKPINSNLWKLCTFLWGINMNFRCIWFIRGKAVLEKRELSQLPQSYLESFSSCFEAFFKKMSKWIINFLPFYVIYGLSLQWNGKGQMGGYFLVQMPLGRPFSASKELKRIHLRMALSVRHAESFRLHPSASPFKRIR